MIFGINWKYVVVACVTAVLTEELISYCCSKYKNNEKAEAEQLEHEKALEQMDNIVASAISEFQNDYKII